jgi:hypothetical protein
MRLTLVRRVFLLFVSGVFLVAGTAWCAQDAEDASTQVHVFGYGGYEFGQIVKGQYAFAPVPQAPVAKRLSHYPMQQALMQIGGEVTRNDGFSISLAAQGRLYFPYALPTDGAGAGGFAVYASHYAWDIHHAEVRYAVGRTESPFAVVGVGLFPFKYNPDGRTFGDYLLRISPHPQFFITHFDAPYQRLLGLRISSDYPFIAQEMVKLRQDLLFTSEIHLWPMGDFSLTYLFNATILKSLDFGAGIMGDRMFPVNDTLTKPPSSSTKFRFHFGGTKLMLRLALDLKRFMPLQELWGESDWRIYSEACVNGIENYPITDSNLIEYPGYDNVKKRVPVLFGFYVPTCKILDVLSIEGEWWDNDFANSYWGVFNAGYQLNPNPYPYPATNRFDPYGGAWHWSVYAKKTVAKNIRIAAQVGRDHSMIETAFSGPSNGDPQEAMDGKGNWGWMTKIEFGF